MFVMILFKSYLFHDVFVFTMPSVMCVYGSGNRFTYGIARADINAIDGDRPKFANRLVRTYRSWEHERDNKHANLNVTKTLQLHTM